MADEITVALQRVHGIRVASRATVRSYASRVQSLDSLAQLLRVRTLLTGTIRRNGNAYQVTAELTEAGTGTAVWAERLQRNSTDLFALQEDVARAIVNGLEVRLAGAAPSAPRGTTDAIAYDLYLRGHAAFQRRGRDGVTRAIAAFDSATRRDPAFARAWGALALVWSQAPGWLFISVDSAVEPTRRAATRALAIDRSLGDAHAALGYLAYYRWEWAEAERLLRQAIANDPSSASAPLWLGELLATIGRTAEAVTVSRRAWELEPLNATAFGNYSYALLCDGRVAEAIDVGERARDTDPSNPLVRIQLATAYAAAGRSGDAERETASPAAGERAPQGLGLIAAFYAAQRGDRTAAERIRRDAERGALDHQPVMRFFLRAALGDTTGATAAMDQAVAEHDVMFIRVKASSPVFDSFRALPRFQAALARAGLDTTRFRPRAPTQAGRAP
jgi:serine/threonine-protein kinase